MGTLIAIAMSEVITLPAVKTDKKIIELVQQLIINQTSDVISEATDIVLTAPQYRGVLRHIVQQAVAGAYCKAVRP